MGDMEKSPKISGETYDKLTRGQGGMFTEQVHDEALERDTAFRKGRAVERRDGLSETEKITCGLEAAEFPTYVGIANNLSEPVERGVLPFLISPELMQSM